MNALDIVRFTLGVVLMAIVGYGLWKIDTNPD